MLQALDSLKCRRRILLSGTPVQNNLDEVGLAVWDLLCVYEQFEKRRTKANCGHVHIHQPV